MTDEHGPPDAAATGRPDSPSASAHEPEAALGAAATPAPVAKKKRRRMRTRNKWFLAVGIALVLILAAVFAVSWKAGQSLLHPERDSDMRTPDTVNMTWEWANFTTVDDVHVVGWWMPADHAVGTVIFLHGYSDNKAQGLEMFPMLHNATVNILAFDFRAHGASGGGYTTAGLLEVQEVDAAIAWVENRTLQGENRIVLLGWSMGAAAGLNAAAEHPHLAGVVAEASFSHLQNIVDTSIGKFTGLPRWPFGPLAVQFASWSVNVDIGDNAPVGALAKYDGPLLLIQGLNDTTVLPSNVDELAGAAPQATVWKVPDAGHTECFGADPAGYQRRVVEFLARALSPPPVQVSS